MAVLEATSRRNAQLLQEIYRVVLVMNPSSPAAFGNWLDSLNQGASLEGVYNGFVHSDFERGLESGNRSTAIPKAIEVFSRELAELLLEFPKVPELDPALARPLGRIGMPGDADEPGAGVDSEGSTSRELSFKPFVPPTSAPAAVRPDRAALEQRIGSLFAGSSIYTMKRVLGDWGLKAAALHLEESPERFRDWYADFAARAAKKGVDFGLELRNESSRAFHREWAARAGEDQIRWEVLNRLHRILNAAQGLVVPAGSN